MLILSEAREIGMEPLDASERNVIAALENVGTPYEVIEIDPAYSDTRLFCERYQYDPQKVCNTILVTSKKGPKKLAACVVLSHTRLDVNKCVRTLLGTTKASFAPAEEVKEFTGMELGGVTPLALPAGLPIFIDERITRTDWVILGGGSRRIKIKVSPTLFLKLGAQVVSNLGLH